MSTPLEGLLQERYNAAADERDFLRAQLLSLRGAVAECIGAMRAMTDMGYVTSHLELSAAAINSITRERELLEAALKKAQEKQP